VVEVRLGFREEFGGLDPYFFALFVQTTPGVERLADLMRDDYHGPSRVFEVLARDGHLRVVTGEWGAAWVVADADRPPHEQEACPPEKSPSNTTPSW
jgi:hypothetical protein